MTFIKLRIILIIVLQDVQLYFHLCCRQKNETKQNKR